MTRAPALATLPRPNMKTNPGSSFWQRLRSSRAAKRIAGAAFLFFLIKGLVWLGIIAAAVWSGYRVAT